MADPNRALDARAAGQDVIVEGGEGHARIAMLAHRDPYEYAEDFPPPHSFMEEEYCPTWGCHCPVDGVREGKGGHVAMSVDDARKKIAEIAAQLRRHAADCRKNAWLNDGPCTCFTSSSVKEI